MAAAQGRVGGGKALDGVDLLVRNNGGEMYLIKPIIFLLLPLYIFAFCKDYQNYNYAFFYGRQPSAKAEALGRTLVASEDNAFTVFYNPAGLTLIKCLHVGFSYASPFYLADKANYNFLGVAYNTGRYGTISFNRFHYSLHEY